MDTLEEIVAMRSTSRPLMAIWKVADAQALGSLIWLDGEPILTLFLQVDGNNGIDIDDNDLPVMNATKPPVQATITAMATKYRVITLENCVRYRVNRRRNFVSGRGTYELDFRPTAVWVGAEKGAIEGCITSVVATDTRLVGFFGSPGLKTYTKFDPKTAQIFSALDEPQSIWTIHGPIEHKIALGNTGWNISVYTGVQERMSATEGHSFHSTVNLRLTAPRPAAIAEASDHLVRIEEILSVFSIEAFIFQFERYCTDTDSITLVWRLGQNRSAFQPPMRHQILIDLSDPITLESVCRQWFLASPTTRLSRWLFVRALRETDDGLSRFVAVAQAFEVLGRELGPERKLPKSKIKDVVKKIRNALSADYEKSFIDRIVNLVGSSNRSSYVDVLYHMLSPVSEYFAKGTDEETKKLCKLISDTRNAVIHMTDDDEGKLTQAFGQVNKLSLNLCFWYAVCQARQMKLDIPNIDVFLFNNRNARHGLPNELLGRD